jgi:hypothetical protein
MIVPITVIKLGATVLGTNSTTFYAIGDHKYLYEYAIDPPLYWNRLNASAPFSDIYSVIFLF